MPITRNHTIFLHGGRPGAKKGNAQASLSHYRAILENRVKCIMAEAAKAVYAWQVPGTSIVKDERPRWSGAFRADWHVKIGDRGAWASSVAEENGRYPWQTGSPANEPGSLTHFIEKERAERVLSGEALRGMGVDDPIHVANVSPYAKWLNYGTPPDYDGKTFLRSSPGYHFIERCIDAVWGSGKWADYIKDGLAAAAKGNG